MVSTASELPLEDLHHSLDLGLWMIECFSPYGHIYDHDFSEWSSADRRSLELLCDLINHWPKNDFTALIDDYTGLDRERGIKFWNRSVELLSAIPELSSLVLKSERRLAEAPSQLGSLSERLTEWGRFSDDRYFLNPKIDLSDLSRSRRKEIRRSGIALCLDGRPSCSFLDASWHHSLPVGSNVLKILPASLKHQQQEVGLLLHSAEASIARYWVVLDDQECPQYRFGLYSDLGLNSAPATFSLKAKKASAHG
jgi:hypothetical protein